MENIEETIEDLKEDWKYEVANGDTVLGFQDWIEHNTEL